MLLYRSCWAAPLVSAAAVLLYRSVPGGPARQPGGPLVGPLAGAAAVLL
jgi:hypothetical protein